MFERECRLNGLPTTGLNAEERIERLVALEEYKVKQLLKEQAKQAKRGISGDSTQSSDRQATHALAELLQGKFEELLP